MWQMIYTQIFKENMLLYSPNGEQSTYLLKCNVVLKQDFQEE